MSMSPSTGALVARTTHQALPRLAVDGPAVDPASCVEPGTATASLLGSIVAVVVFVVLTLASSGIILLVGLAGAVWGYFLNKRSLAAIKGSGVKVGPDQLAEIHAAVTTMSERLGLKAAPDVFLIETNVINAAAVKLGKRNVILLTDDLIDACLRTGHFDALGFVLGHELGHMALGHNGWFRSYTRTVLRKLGRLDEYSADRVAASLLRNKEAAAHGLLILTAGPHVLPYINVEALAEQAAEVKADGLSVKAEKTMTHPLLLHRLYRTLNESRAM